MLKVRNIIGFLALATVVGLGLSAIHPVGITRQDNQSFLELLVEFTPTPRTAAVTIVVSVDGKASAHQATTSPWSKTIPVKKGMSVLLGAAQIHPGKLSCSIRRTDLDFGARNERSDAGRVDCRYFEA